MHPHTYTHIKCDHGFTLHTCTHGCTHAHTHKNRCSANVHSQPTRMGHNLGPFQRPERTTEASDRGLDGGGGKKRDAKKAKVAARTLPACARRAEAFVKTMKVLKHKVNGVNGWCRMYEVLKRNANGLNEWCRRVRSLEAQGAWCE